MTTQNYVGQSLKYLGQPFYNKLINERLFMIWMFDCVFDHISKFTTHFCHEAGFLFMN